MKMNGANGGRERSTGREEIFSFASFSLSESVTIPFTLKFRFIVFSFWEIVSDRNSFAMTSSSSNSFSGMFLRKKFFLIPSWNAMNSKAKKRGIARIDAACNCM